MRDVLLITGPMRSGTAAVAAMAHRMGFIAAETMTPPRPPRWHPDWEDAAALQALLEIWPLGEPVTIDTRVRFSRWFDQYVNARGLRASSLNHSGEMWIRGMTIKSPWYAPFIPEIRDICHMSGIKLKIVVCLRDPAEADAANAVANEYQDQEALARHQKAIREGIAVYRARATLGSQFHVVPFDMLVSEPAAESRQLADFLNVDPGDAETVIDPRRAPEGV